MEDFSLSMMFFAFMWLVPVFILLSVLLSYDVM